MRISLDSEFHRDRRELYRDVRMGALLGSPIPRLRAHDPLKRTADAWLVATFATSSQKLKNNPMQSPFIPIPAWSIVHISH